jgi:hypothetical protein
VDKTVTLGKWNYKYTFVLGKNGKAMLVGKMYVPGGTLPYGYRFDAPPDIVERAEQKLKEARLL